MKLDSTPVSHCSRLSSTWEPLRSDTDPLSCSAAAEDIRRRSSSVADWQEDDSMTVEAGSSPRPRSCLVAGDRNRVVELQHIPDHGRDVKHVRTKSGDAKSGEPKLVIEV